MFRSTKLGCMSKLRSMRLTWFWTAIASSMFRRPRGLRPGLEPEWSLTTPITLAGERRCGFAATFREGSTISASSTSRSSIKYQCQTILLWRISVAPSDLWRRVSSQGTHAFMSDSRVLFRSPLCSAFRQTDVAISFLNATHRISNQDSISIE